MTNVILCDIDKTIFANKNYLGSYYVGNDNMISFDVYNGSRSKHGYAKTEEEMVKSIEEWINK